MTTTIDYYNKNAEKFFNETVNVDMSKLYEPFLRLLPKGAKILDAGCGSGRDSLAFKNLGYEVTAFDASKELVKLASEYLGQSVGNLRFEDINYENEFDGIWACASLLHVPKDKIQVVLKKLTASLIDTGILYASFKYGNKSYSKQDRFFNCYTEKSIISVIGEIKILKVKKISVTDDMRKVRKGERWLNIYMIKNCIK